MKIDRWNLLSTLVVLLVTLAVQLDFGFAQPAPPNPEGQWLVVNGSTIDDDGRVVWVGEDGKAASVYQTLAGLRLGRGYLGVQVLPMTAELLQYFEVESDSGLLVASVEGPASMAGLSVGDVLIELDGKPIRSATQLKQAVARRSDGDHVHVEYSRDGERVEVKVEIRERDVSSVDLAKLASATDQLAFRVDPQLMSTVQAQLQSAFADKQVQQQLQEWRDNRVVLQQRIRQLEQQLQQFHRELQRIRRQAR